MSINRYRLQSMQSAQCHVVIATDEHDCVVSASLVSYQTTVCKIYYSGAFVRMECYGTYSNTTARHINRFTTEFCGENMYHECKRHVKNGFIQLTVNQTTHFLCQCRRYLNNTFPAVVRKYFGKY